MARLLNVLVAGRGVDTTTVLGFSEAERPKIRSMDPYVGGIERCMNSAERETGKRTTESWKRMQRVEGGEEVEGGIYCR
jgi:hypothetical protein